MKKTIALLAAGAAFLLFACGGRSERTENEKVPEYVLTYAENQPEDYPTTQGAYYFARLVEERSGGRIRSGKGGRRNGSGAECRRAAAVRWA